MRGPFTLLLVGFAAMFGPLVGASMPWAAPVHAMVFGGGEAIAVPALMPVAPHLAFAFTGVLIGTVVAWVGMAWACWVLVRHGWAPGEGTRR